MNAPSPAPALKDGFGAGTVAWIADRVAAVHPGFDARAFHRIADAGFDALSLMARVGRVADALAATLPADFEAALATVEAALGPPPPARVDAAGIAGFRVAPFLDWVARAGLARPGSALPALGRLTRHFTAEFALRPFIGADADAVFAHAAGWVRDADPRVRRLASEGTRPLLPWGRHVAVLKQHPERALALIAPLAADPDEVVRRSAANHLNDVSRLDPALALATARDWLGAGDAARPTVRHALRTRIKQGDPEALHLLGFDVSAPVALHGLRLSATRVPIGGELRVAADLRADGPVPVTACVDFAVRYASARGAPRVKVFKGRTTPLAPGEACTVQFRRDFVPRTTRVLYPGTHAVEVRVNGRTLGEATFEVVA